MEETNMPIVAKKLWNTVRVMFYMLKKGIISKRKLMADLNLMMTRGKIAGKAFHDLVFPFHHSTPGSPIGHVSSSPRVDYKFIFEKNNIINIHINNFFKRKTHRHSHLFACAHAPSVDDDVASTSSVGIGADVAASPFFWVNADVSRVRRVRITDSPFPLCDADEDCHVDKAAEEFISRFYKELRRQD